MAAVEQHLQVAPDRGRGQLQPLGQLDRGRGAVLHDRLLHPLARGGIVNGALRPGRLVLGGLGEGDSGRTPVVSHVFHNAILALFLPHASKGTLSRRPDGVQATATAIVRTS